MCSSNCQVSALWDSGPAPCRVAGNAGQSEGMEAWCSLSHCFLFEASPTSDPLISTSTRMTNENRSDLAPSTGFCLVCFIPHLADRNSAWTQGMNDSCVGVVYFYYKPHRRRNLFSSLSSSIHHSLSNIPLPLPSLSFDTQKQPNSPYRRNISP